MYINILSIHTIACSLLPELPHTITNGLWALTAAAASVCTQLAILHLTLTSYVKTIYNCSLCM